MSDLRNTDTRRIRRAELNIARALIVGNSPLRPRLDIGASCQQIGRINDGYVFVPIFGLASFVGGVAGLLYFEWFEHHQRHQ